MGRGLAGELDDVLTEIGLDRSHPGFDQGVVELDLLGRHRLALDRELDPAAPSDLEDVLAGLRSIAGPEDPAPVGEHLLLQLHQVPIEVVDGFPPGRSSPLPEALPVGALPCGLDPRQTEAGGGSLEGPLERNQLQGPIGGFGESLGGGFHAGPARSSARWMVVTASPWRWRTPAIWSRQEGSQETTVSAPVAAIAAALAWPMEAEIRSNLIEKVPPKPQHWRLSSSSTRVQPSTAWSRRRGSSLIPSSRRE